MVEEPEERISLTGTFLALVLIGIFARLSYGTARTPLLALFARSLLVAPTIIGCVRTGFLLTHLDYVPAFGAISIVFLAATNNSRC